MKTQKKFNDAIDYGLKNDNHKYTTISNKNRLRMTVSKIMKDKGNVERQVMKHKNEFISSK